MSNRKKAFTNSYETREQTLYAKAYFENYGFKVVQNGLSVSMYI